MKVRKLRRIRAEKNGRGTVVSFRGTCERWASDTRMIVIHRRYTITSWRSIEGYWR
jgi:hypothetical protein